MSSTWSVEKRDILRRRAVSRWEGYRKSSNVLSDASMLREMKYCLNIRQNYVLRHQRSS